jgi:hypothetical protein
MNIDESFTRTAPTSSVPTSNTSPATIAATAVGYTYNVFLQGNRLATRSVTGDRSDPWMRTVNRIVTGVGIGLSTSLLIMRVYTKARIMRKFWWDDSMSVCVVNFYNPDSNMSSFYYPCMGMHSFWLIPESTYDGHN